LSEEAMNEDVEEFTPLWWKVRWYHDTKIENKLIEAIRAKDKPSTGTVYRIFLGVCGVLFFFTGWIIWNIALPAEGESGTLGANLETFLFFFGIFVQFILGPYFAFISISNDGRLSPLVPKAHLEYFRLKNSILGKEVYDHYWAAIRDPSHEHHNEIIRYKWMDKIRWKHRPSDFFGYQIFTKESGEETRGPLVPKSSEAYRNSNFTLGDNGEPVFQGPTHPLRQVFTLPMFLFIFSLLNSPMTVINIINLIINKDWINLVGACFSLLLVILLGLYLIRRNTDLINPDTDVSLEDLEEKLRSLSERYITIP